MSLKNNVDQKSEAIKSNGPKRNPDIDPLVDKYIQENPSRIAYLKTESKEQLIRRVVVGDAIRNAEKAKRQVKENEAIGKFLKENPEISQDIEKRISNVPDDRKQQARIRLGRDAATKTALKI